MSAVKTLLDLFNPDTLMPPRGFAHAVVVNSGRQMHLAGLVADDKSGEIQHRNDLVEGFSKEHGCKLLVWYEVYDDLDAARLRELQMKKWKRAWKIELIEQHNPQWKALYETLF